GENTKRAQHFRGVLVVRELAERLHVAVIVFDGLRVIVDEVRRLFRIAERLHAVLADLDAHQRRDFVAPRANVLGGTAHRCYALLPGKRRPLALRSLCRSYRAVDLRRARAAKRTEDDLAVDRRTHFHDRAFAGHGRAVDVGMLHETEPGADRLERRIEFAMDLIEIAADR